MKRKYILTTGAIGVIFMMLGQLSFSINDSLVKLIVVDTQKNLSILNVIFLRGLITTFYFFIFKIL
jgi:hypothetical protein